MASRTVSSPPMLEAPKLDVSILDRGWTLTEVASASVRELLTTEPLGERDDACELRRFLLSPPLLVWGDPKTMDKLEVRELEYLLAMETDATGTKAQDGHARSDSARAATARVVAVARDMFWQRIL